MKVPNYKSVIIISVTIVLIVIITVAGFFIWNNLSFLGLNLNRNEIVVNNSSSEKEGDYVELKNKQLIVPERYKKGAFATDKNLNMPANFSVSVYASGMTTPRAMTFDTKNNLYVTDIKAGKVFYLPDINLDGIADEVVEFDKDLQSPHGIFYHNNDLYVAESSQVVVYRKINAKSFDKKEVLINNLPSDGGHVSRTLIIGPDQKIYVSIGSTCNVCEEKDERRAAIVRYNLDGTGEEIYTRGLRNSVGIIFKDNEIWSVDNGRDLIGDDLPPEEVNVITKKGEDFGWPFCYGKGINNPEYPDKADFCKNTKFPKFEMPAHSAPLGLSFVPSGIWSGAFAKDLIIPFHGSWNRTTPTGYKLIRLNTENGNQINFITGWLTEDGSSWGRPVDVIFDNKGQLFITDDKAGAVYKVSYQKN